ncbi:MAG: glycosyltransferase family 4 protein [Bryobacterales bacterium]|nr:glycosyltransferase family 4 protein [Bryobacterales bacterium]
MNVGLDATPLTEATGGIARYTCELSLALAREYPCDNFFLLSDRPFQHPSAAPANLHCLEAAISRVTRRWWSTGLPKAIRGLGLNLFHGTDFAVPYRWSPPSVMTLHDLSPWMPGAWNRSSRIVRRTPWLLRLGFAKAVITPSEAVRKEVISYFGLAEDRVVAVPLAAASVFRPLPPESQGTPFLLAVGTIEPRKNLGIVVDAWRSLRHDHAVGLKIVGRSRSDSPVFAPADGLEFLGAVSDDELVRLYSGALAVLMPSVYEGFGLPVLEAMQCGAPVAVSAAAALGEVSGGAALRVDGDWSEALRALLGNAGLRARLSEQSLARARQFSWPATARKTYSVYQQALGER